MGIFNMIAAMIAAVGEIQEFMVWLYSISGGFLWTIS